MKVLIIGADGRAHALVWKLFNSPLVDELVCMPGNGGTGIIAPSANLDTSQAATVARWAFDEGIDIIVPADSRTLRHGLVDEVVAFHIGVCGPSQRSTILERSRCAAKAFFTRHHLPTAPGSAFADLATAEKYLATQHLPVIIKADNPVAGEAVYDDRHAALTGLRDLFAARLPEVENKGVVIESYLHGVRVVQSAFTDGRTAVPLLPTRLYDHVQPGDTGPSAGGLGAHTSTSQYAQLLSKYLHQKFITPIVAGLASEGLPYWGILGIDCVITNKGPHLIGVRCSLHEGEAQVVLPRLDDDLLPWIQAMIAQRLRDLPPPRWKPMPSVGIGIIGRGYPHHFSVGNPIQGLEDLDEGVLVFHSATESSGGLRYTPQANQARSDLFGLLGGTPSAATLRVSGGHVLTVVAMAATLAEARERALHNVERIRFEGRTFRDDIAAKEFG